MAYSFKLNIPEDSAEGKAIASLVESEHLTVPEAAQRLLRQGISTDKTKTKRKKGDIWGMFGDEAEILDRIVNEAMIERRRKFERHLDA